MYVYLSFRVKVLGDNSRSYPFVNSEGPGSDWQGRGDGKATAEKGGERES